MRRVIVLGSIASIVVLSVVYLAGQRQATSTEDSPAFQALLSQAIARLESTPQQITAATVAEARAEDPLATVDAYTCSGFRTCDYIVTCDGTATCDGEVTCWWSTFWDGSCPTCNGVVPDCCEDPYTMQGGVTCDGEATCKEGCAGWPTYFPMTTCDGSATCALTCPDFVSCNAAGPSATERTTWGRVKAEFAE
jgi:ferredoxin